MTTSGDLFNGFEIDEICGYVLDQEGPEGLRQLMDLIGSDHKLDRESLIKAADKLESAGISEGAAIVREAAERIADRTPAEIVDILDDPHRGNQKARLASLYRRGELTLEMMIEAGVDSDVAEYVCRSTGPLARRYLQNHGMMHLVRQAKEARY